MRHRLRAACLAILVLVAAPASAQRAVILVRHAEKVDQSKDAALSPAGHVRAKALASLLANASVTRVFATQYRRTSETVQPLAEARGLKVEVVNADAPARLLEEISRSSATDVVLVAGHSNTVPDLLKRLGWPEAVEIADDDFGSVFILVPRPGASPSMVRLRY